MLSIRWVRILSCVAGWMRPSRHLTQALQVYGQDPLALCDQSEVYGDLAYVNEMRGNVHGEPAALSARL